MSFESSLGPANAICVLDVPGTPDGPLATRCQGCDKKYPTAVSTVTMLHKMKQAGKPYLVICWTCFLVVKQEYPDLGINSPVVGVREAQHALGLD